MRKLGQRWRPLIRTVWRGRFLGIFDIGEMNSFIETLEKRFDEHKSAMANLKTEIREREQIIKQIQPISAA
jgi:hypothetical protein